MEKLIRNLREFDENGKEYFHFEPAVFQFELLLKKKVIKVIEQVNVLIFIKFNLFFFCSFFFCLF